MYLLGCYTIDFFTTQYMFIVYCCSYSLFDTCRVVSCKQALLGQRNRKQTKVFDPHSNREHVPDGDSGLHADAARDGRDRGASKARPVRLRGMPLAWWV